MLSIIAQKRQEIAAICKASHLVETALPVINAHEPGEASALSTHHSQAPDLSLSWASVVEGLNLIEIL